VRRVGSRNNDLLKDILLGILGTIVVGFSKLGNTVPFRTRVHISNIDTHTPILENIDDIVNVLLGPAHLILAEAVVRGTSAARVLTENALFMNSWRCFSMSSAAFSAMNMSSAVSWAVVKIEPLVAGIKLSSLSYLSPPSSES